MRFRRDHERFIGGYDPEHEMPDPDRDPRDRYQSEAYRHNARDSRFMYRWDPDRFEDRFDRGPGEYRPNWDRDARDPRYGGNLDYGRSGYGGEGYGREMPRYGRTDYDRWSYGRESGGFRGDRGYDRWNGGGYVGESRGGYGRAWDDAGYSGRDDFERGRYFGGGDYGGGREDRGWDRERGWDRGDRDDYVNDRSPWDRNRRW